MNAVAGFGYLLMVDLLPQHGIYKYKKEKKKKRLTFL